MLQQQVDDPTAGPPSTQWKVTCSRQPSHVWHHSYHHWNIRSREEATETTDEIKEAVKEATAGTAVGKLGKKLVVARAYVRKSGCFGAQGKSYTQMQPRSDNMLTGTIMGWGCGGGHSGLAKSGKGNSFWTHCIARDTFVLHLIPIPILLYLWLDRIEYCTCSQNLKLKSGAYVFCDICCSTITHVCSHPKFSLIFALHLLQFIFLVCTIWIEVDVG